MSKLVIENSGYCDSPLSTSTSWISSGTGICATHMIDGVVSLTTNDQIRINFNVNNAVGAFYANPMAQLSCAQLATTNVSPTGTPLSGTVMSLSGIMTVNANAYSVSPSITLVGYNSANQISSTATVTNFRIDTVSTQQAQRKTAASGQFPTVGYDLAYDNNVSLNNNEELQMISGQIQYPPKINYGTYVPSGVNYLNVPSGSFSGYRWGFFDMGSITNTSNIQITFNTTTNFGATTILTGFLLYAKISGATNGWIDGNVAYPGVGNPTNNGDPALVVGSSNTTVKLITFGTAALTGPVYIRVGLPSGSIRSFGSISMIAV